MRRTVDLERIIWRINMFRSRISSWVMDRRVVGAWMPTYLQLKIQSSLFKYDSPRYQLVLLTTLTTIPVIWKIKEELKLARIRKPKIQSFISSNKAHPPSLAPPAKPKTLPCSLAIDRLSSSPKTPQSSWTQCSRAASSRVCTSANSF